MADRLIVYRDDTEQFRWRRVAANQEKLSAGEAHTRLYGAIRAAYRDNPDLQNEPLLIEDADGRTVEFVERNRLDERS